MEGFFLLEVAVSSQYRAANIQDGSGISHQPHTAAIFEVPASRDFESLVNKFVQPEMRSAVHIAHCALKAAENNGHAFCQPLQIVVIVVPDRGAVNRFFDLDGDGNAFPRIKGGGAATRDGKWKRHFEGLSLIRSGTFRFVLLSRLIVVACGPSH